MKPRDWSQTANSNTLIGTVSIAEGCPPGNINNAIRELMAEIATELAYWTGVQQLTNTEWIEHEGSSTVSGQPAYEGADAQCFDDWAKTSTTKAYREASTVKVGAKYAVKLVSDASGGNMTWTAPAPESFRGRRVTIGGWVHASAANKARFSLYDGTNSTYSEYHAGSGAYEWLEVTADISSSASTFVVGLPLAASQTVYLSQPMLVYGQSIGSGNYVPPIPVPPTEDTYIPNQIWS